jgi:hypothetical protein
LSNPPVIHGEVESDDNNNDVGDGVMRVKGRKKQIIVNRDFQRTGED